MIEIGNLFKTYGGDPVLAGFSHRFGDRGITCLLGASGSGKSTLLNLLAGFDRGYRGEIVVAGRNIAELSDRELVEYRKRCIGFVFQEYHLLSGYTVLENILLAAELGCSDGEKNQARALRLLERLGIKEKAHERVENLSGGQKQRVAIARALVGDPDVILADEPTGALDRNTANEIMELFAEIAQDRLVLLITHDPKICQFADEVISIEEGKCRVLREAESKAHFPCGASARLAQADASPSMRRRAWRSFRAHFRRFLGIALAISVAVCAVLLSFSSQNIIEGSIGAFEEKNTVFEWGQVTLGDEAGLDALLSALDRSDAIEVYYGQHPVPEGKIVAADKEILLDPKSFGGIAGETVNMGAMPQDGQIAITPSLAKKLAGDIRALIGECVTFSCGDFSKELIVSGIFNGSFDDYYLGADVEQALYASLPDAGRPVSVAYKAKGFYEVPRAEAELRDAGFAPDTASKQVEGLMRAFEELRTLFAVVSALVAAIAVFACLVILAKTMRMRRGEMGLLMALGYSKGQIGVMLLCESLMLAALSALGTVLLLLLLAALSGAVYAQVVIMPWQIAGGLCGASALVWAATTFSSTRLLRTDPAVVLRG